MSISPFPVCSLLTLLLLCRTAFSATPIVLFTYQSQHILFQDWCVYITLCFAPLIAHVVGGVSSRVVVPAYAKEPSWTACLPHYNPISIVWRWYAIADRRLRARDWDAADMAACNAIFWDAEKARWDGSEDIMLRSRAWITKVCGRAYVPLLSTSSLTTGVLALQGVQASFVIFALRRPDFGEGLQCVFLPLAFLGLLRLPAALWLSGDYGYLDAVRTESGETSTANMDDAGNPGTTKLATAIATPSSTTLPNLSGHTTADKWRLHSTRTSIAILYRIWWFLSITGIFAAGAVSACRQIWGHPPSFHYISLSHLLMSTTYLILSTSALLITSTYVLRGRTKSTLIPCINATWYKAFTVVLAPIGLAVIIVAALETRQLANGETSTLPEFQCKQTKAWCTPVARGYGNFNI
jgi:hypothetical protein